MNNDICILERGKEFSYVLHLESERRIWMPNAYIYDKTHCMDYTDYVLPPRGCLIAGTGTSKGYLVKKDGVSDWYYGALKKV